MSSETKTALSIGIGFLTIFAFINKMSNDNTSKALLLIGAGCLSIGGFIFFQVGLPILKLRKEIKELQKDGAIFSSPYSDPDDDKFYKEVYYKALDELNGTNVSSSKEAVKVPKNKRKVPVPPSYLTDRYSTEQFDKFIDSQVSEFKNLLTIINDYNENKPSYVEYLERVLNNPDEPLQ